MGAAVETQAVMRLETLSRDVSSRTRSHVTACMVGREDLAAATMHISMSSTSWTIRMAARAVDAFDQSDSSTTVSLLLRS